MKKLKLSDLVKICGNVVGASRRDGWKKASVAFCIASVVDSDVLPARLNHDGVPVVTNIAGLRGAYVNGDSAQLFAQGINMGLKQTKLWHQDVRQNGR